MATFSANVKGLYIVPIPLSANLTNITLTSALDGQQVVLEFQQDVTGGWTVASSSISGLQQPIASANTSSFQVFIWNGSLAEWQSIGGGSVTGVSSLNTLTGALTLAAGTNVTITPSGGNTLTFTASGSAGPPGTSNVPWFDIQNYGGVPREFSISQDVKQCSTTGGSPNVTLSAAGSFANGDDIVIWGAGAATSQTTPGTPTATCPSVQGINTLNYKCVGVDAFGGLTVAGAAGQATNVPTIFGNVAVLISSISLTSNVVTVNTGSPINAVAGQTIHITNVTAGGTGYNGVWVIASAPSSTQVTFALTAANSTGTVSASTMARISNVAVIAAISRTSGGIITITTAQPHGFVNTSSGYGNQSIVIVENVTPSDLLGEFRILSVTSNTITCDSAIFSAETGSVTAGQSTATCYEYVLVTCPAYTSGTIAYYVYSDSPSPGGALTLIGKTLPGERQFKDWGPSYGGGYTAPGYVPTTAPSSTTNQLFSGTISTGGGTTSLVLTTNVTTSIGALGTSIVKDDGQALIAAIAAAQTTSALTGTVLLSPPLSPFVAFPQYVINYPVTVPANINITFGCALQCNETLTFAGSNKGVNLDTGSAYNVTPGFGIGNYARIGGTNGGVGGVASPMIYVSGAAVELEGLAIMAGGSGGNNLNVHNGQYGIVIKNNKSIIKKCFLSAGDSGTCVPLTYSSIPGGGSWHSLEDCQFSGASIYVNGQSTHGQSDKGPAVGVLNFHCSDSTSGIYCANISMYGNTSFAGRGILFDGLVNSISQSSYISFGTTGFVEYQAATTPAVMFWTDVYSEIEVHNFLIDSTTMATVANWCSNLLADVWIDNCASSGTGTQTVTGRPIDLLHSTRNSYPTGNPVLGQTTGVISRVGGFILTTTGTTSDTVAMLGSSAFSLVSITPGNAAAQADYAAGNVGIGTLGTDSVQILHGSTSGMVFHVMVTVN